ncbi:hypothetical protein PR202_ga01765 [Eleusine coracana subsp. coracana]|uniref:Uncharacterized protein n=1 Tax=Eleusine coracana subsp. coracana TaxID=191504 RepID=A0AAV5BJV6_ELECO|nr:hypothetical protein PR202_ga01078 [Eleusine coracana subsp. coracana]GJM85953.1 hypothetical protein PR202_ga01765 [Eleusine coracana subsp. coracana]
MEMQEEQRVETTREKQQKSDADAGKKKEGAMADERVRVLEREVASSKHTEMKMLESLIQQTKELEQAKVALEEANLQLATLRQQHHQRGGATTETPAAPAAQWSVMDLMFGGVDEEINGLKAKLRAAAQGEERSRKAAGELTAALSAVTMEAKQVKAWLADAQAEAERASAEADRLRCALHVAEAELWSATEQIGRLTDEWKAAAASWRAREKALLARARAAEDAAAAARRAMERALEEASAAGESLEIATTENARMQDAVAAKEGELDSLRRENEALKAGERAARARARELEDQLTAISPRKAAADGGGVGRKAMELPLSKLSAAAFLDSGRVVGGRKDRMFASLSNLTELKSAAAAAAMADDYSYEFDHFDDVGQYGDPDHAAKQHRKRRSILRKFGDLFRRRSGLYKSNLAPVLHHY